MRVGKLTLVAVSVVAWLSAPAARALPEQQAGPAVTQGIEQLEQFLRTARVVEMEDFPPGNTRLQKVTLAQGETVHHAAFRGAGSEPGVKDSWRFEIAAYQIDKLIGLNMVPPTVERTLGDTRGSLQFWIENALSEDDRLEKKIDPPDVQAWDRQIWKVTVFDYLVSNIDRNLGSLLYDRNWKVHIIAHRRTFEVMPGLENSQELTHFSVSMMEALKKLDRVNLTRSCAGYLSGPQIDTVLSRRDKILEAYRLAVAQKGASVTYP